jgi:predicted TIM-barrel fold metal-dependent hydrolase
MKIIALEEHYQLAEIQQAVAKFLPAQKVFQQVPYNPSTSQLEDLGVGRIRRMDAMGIDVQVLSYTTAGLPAIPAAEAIALAREINDRLAAAIAIHPDRFAGFAALPTPDPEAAATELVRAVNQLGLKGALITGRTNGRFLDDPTFSPILEAATELDVPIYLHPAVPPKAVQDACYTDLDPAVSLSFATAGWGWHVETGTHALHIILSGVLDRYPSLQLILGHWGEMIPFYLARFDEALNPVARHLQRPVADYFLQQMYVTPSGMFTLPPFLLTLQIMGAERIMYSVDYPYLGSARARTFLEQAPISPADKEKIAHGNAEKILKLAHI